MVRSLCPPPRLRRADSFPTAFRGDLTSHAPHFHPASEAAARDIDLVTARQLLPDSLSVGVHMSVSNPSQRIRPVADFVLPCRGSYSRPSEPHATRPKVKEDIKYTREDDKAIDEWIADRESALLFVLR